MGWKPNNMGYFFSRNLIVTQLQSNCNSTNYNLVIQASLSLVRCKPKLIICLV